MRRPKCRCFDGSNAACTCTCNKRDRQYSNNEMRPSACVSASMHCTNACSCGRGRLRSVRNANAATGNRSAACRSRSGPVASSCMCCACNAPSCTWTASRWLAATCTSVSSNSASNNAGALSRSRASSRNAGERLPAKRTACWKSSSAGVATCAATCAGSTRTRYGVAPGNAGGNTASTLGA
ncbi:hypothetical protein D3C81_1744380 [compost metagenome]